MSDTPELAGGEQNLRVNLREGLFQAGGEQLDGAQQEHAHQSEQHVMGASLVVWWLRLYLPMQGVWV